MKETDPHNAKAVPALNEILADKSNEKDSEQLSQEDLYSVNGGTASNGIFREPTKHPSKVSVPNP